jgi:hypothetical protein
VPKKARPATEAGCQSGRRIYPYAFFWSLLVPLHRGFDRLPEQLSRLFISLSSGLDAPRTDRLEWEVDARNRAAAAQETVENRSGPHGRARYTHARSTLPTTVWTMHDAHVSMLLQQPIGNRVQVRSVGLSYSSTECFLTVEQIYSPERTYLTRFLGIYRPNSPASSRSINLRIVPKSWR